MSTASPPRVTSRVGGFDATHRAWASIDARTWISVTVVLVVAVVGRLAMVGGDARWLAALGHLIVEHHGIPAGVAFASAATAHWPNSLVLAELIFYALERTMGDSGLLAAQSVAVGVALWILARDARAAGAGVAGTCQALLLVTLGAFTSFTLARVQLFSLVLFPLLLTLLRADRRAPSRRVWLVLPLLALWSNLHGTALAGLAILYLYLSFSLVRKSPVRAGLLAVIAPLAMCATPAGLRTVDYYYGLTTNLAAQRGTGMWAPLGLGLFDVLLVLAALVLAARAWRAAKPPVWETIGIALLAVLTVRASRNGVWLLFLLAAPGAHASRARRDWLGLVPLAAVAAAVLLVSDVVNWSHASRAMPAGIARAVALAHGTPILADSVDAERVALAGGRIWAGNPLDAFSRPVQATYLDFDAGLPSGRAALALRAVRVVVVGAGDGAWGLVAHDRDFREAGVYGNTVLYTRKS